MKLQIFIKSKPLNKICSVVLINLREDERGLNRWGDIRTFRRGEIWVDIVGK